ncbi:hypothetical protein SBRY_170011 [Actinacidiphila bryophytorum]|uniref:Uncharacterized protein n=1 Tax=Actinacidiphila bryophytorum TaxID=1436133 RepID=A0A9W4E3V4_9ACTN|nr:hypothetical protein SBRY_170011 [Actinacidiphila bryophytorum]
MGHCGAGSRSWLQPTRSDGSYRRPAAQQQGQWGARQGAHGGEHGADILPHPDAGHADGRGRGRGREEAQRGAVPERWKESSVHPLASPSPDTAGPSGGLHHFPGRNLVEDGAVTNRTSTLLSALAFGFFGRPAPLQAAVPCRRQALPEWGR